jgi:hypothetical protein
VGIRETLNQHPKATTGVTAAIVVIALAVIVYQLTRPSGQQASSGLVYYSNDDGKTYFSDSASKVPPFDKDGKPAVRAYVWKCEDGTLFVSHLERVSPESMKKIQELQKRGAEVPDAEGKEATAEGKGGRPPMGTGIMALMNDKEVKPVGTGDTGWVKMSSPEGRQVGVPKCPDGSISYQPVGP